MALFPKSHARPRVDDRYVLSGSIFVSRKWSALPNTSPGIRFAQKLYNCWKRWSDMGIFIRMMDELSAAKAEPRTITIMRPLSKHTAQLQACG